MQLTERINNCNGCSACVIGCKRGCIKMEGPAEGRIKKHPVKNEDGCSKCNACVLYCPLFNPVDMPEFKEFYESEEKYENRNMPEVYRQTMRSVKTGQYTEFTGTLCEIAALQSLMGNKLRPNLKIYPLHCDEEKRAKDPACQTCIFYK